MFTRLTFGFLLASTFAMAGGFDIEFGNPTANSDPKAKDTAVVVRATGCHNPEQAVFTATAEGKVDGKRQSIPLQVIALSTPGTYAVKKQWPDKGAWVLTFAGS